MPYIILVLGLLIGLLALYRFMLRADAAQVKALFLTAGIVAMVVGAFFLAITGRLPAAIALGGAVIPLAIGYLRQKQSIQGGATTQNSPISSRADALDVLGLKEGASDDDIKSAYKKLMQKVHPDHEGSEFFAAQLNQARDVLLKK